MQKSYTSSYLKIYLWQGISIITSFLSMFVVIPRLTSAPSIYGVYTICISISIFFSYADLGFMGSAFKYASECFYRNERDEEIKITGFASFILLLFVVLIALAILFISFNPEILIKNLHDPNESLIASKLLRILALFSPVLIFQQVLRIIYGIRIEDYIFQRIFVAGNIIKIISVFYFFNSSHYDIIGYFLFSQIMNLISCIASSIIAKKRYLYDFWLLIYSIRFSTTLYKKIKGLAYASLYLTIVWIVYYELDSIAIVKIFGAKELAFYAIGLSLMSFLRGIYGMLYGPFQARFNHFSGINNEEKLIHLFKNVIILTLPFVLFPIITLVVLMKPFVYCWVGNYYSTSVLIAQFLVLTYIEGFISYPASILITVQEKKKMLYVINSYMPVIFWTGVLLSKSYIGIVAFALFKFVVSIFMGGVYLKISIHFLKYSFLDFFRNILKPVVIPTLFLIVILFYLKQFLPLEKSTWNIFIIVATGGGVSFFAFLIYFGSTDYLRNHRRNVLKIIFRY